MMTPHELEELVSQDNWRSMLLDLIVKNEIDPWDVDVDALARAFIEKVKGMERTNFYVPANVVLALAIVLKYKSMSLNFQEEEDALPEVEDIPISDERIIRKKPRIPLTLVDIFEKIEETIKKVEASTPKRENKPQAYVPPKIELNIEDVQKEVEEIYTKILSLSKMGKVYFSQISSQDRELASRVLLSLLFLSNEGKLELVQERLFEDIELVVKDAKENN